MGPDAGPRLEPAEAQPESTIHKDLRSKGELMDVRRRMSALDAGRPRGQHPEADNNGTLTHHDEHPEDTPLQRQRRYSRAKLTASSPLLQYIGSRDRILG